MRHDPPDQPFTGASHERLHAYLFSAGGGPWPDLSTLLGHTPVLQRLDIWPTTAGRPGLTPGFGDLVLVLTMPGGGVIHTLLAGPLARGLVGLLVDGETMNPSTPPAPLAAAEAGLLTGLAAAALQDLNQEQDQASIEIQDIAVVRDVAVVRDEDGPTLGLVADPALGFELTVACGPASGRLVVGLDSAATRALQRSAKQWRPPPSIAGGDLPGDLPLVAEIELTRTEVVWSRLTGLEPGDAIVFPTPAPPDDHWPIHLAVAGLVFPATLRRTASGRDIEIRGSSMNPTDSTDPKYPGEPSEQPPEPLARGDLLDRLPVTLTAVLGRVELTAGDVARLAPGVVISLDHPVGGTVQLRAGSRPIGVGELVEVDGSVGVRLTELTL